MDAKHAKTNETTETQAVVVDGILHMVEPGQPMPMPASREPEPAPKEVGEDPEEVYVRLRGEAYAQHLAEGWSPPAGSTRFDVDGIDHPMRAHRLHVIERNIHDPKGEEFQRDLAFTALSIGLDVEDGMRSAGWVAPPADDLSTQPEGNAPPIATADAGGSGADLRFREAVYDDPPSESPIVLKHPFTFDGERYERIDLQPPAFGDVEAVARGQMSGLELYARMAGVPLPVMQALRWADSERVTVLAQLLAPGLRSR